MNYNLLQDNLDKIVGLHAWGIKIGPVGMHIHFGNAHIELFGNLTSEVGQYSLWVQSKYRITSNKILIFEEYYPLEENVSKIRELIENKNVLRAGIDENNNSLRLLFDGSILFSAFPGNNSEEDFCWIFYDHQNGDDKKIVVYKDLV